MEPQFRRCLDREVDAVVEPETFARSGAEWPFGYGELEPYYSMAERILGVTGVPGPDCTEPYHGSGHAVEPAILAPLSQRIASAARGLNLPVLRINP